MNGARLTPEPLEIAHAVTAQFAGLPQVEAVALGGSLTTGMAAPESDLDLYVYQTALIPVEARARIILPRANRHELNNQVWETGDEWVEAASGRRVDVMYRAPDFIEGELDRVLVLNEAAVGYSTALWHNVLTAIPLFDRNGWFAKLQMRARVPYPEKLRAAIIAKNYPILSRALSSYRYQIERALQRGDQVSVNHRVAALLASYFDVIFALNRLPHPGEKRQVAHALQHGDRLPAAMARQIARVLDASGTDLLDAIDALVAGLDDLLRGEGLSPLGNSAAAQSG